MSETYEYITFNTYREQEQIDSLSLDDHQTNAHIKALIRDGGSTSETIVTCFVKNDIERLVKLGYSLAQAWERLDGFQHDLVFQLRAFMGTVRAPQGNESFVSFFYRCCVQDKYDELSYEIDDFEDCSTAQQVAIAEQATKAVNSVLAKVSNEVFPLPFTVEVEPAE